VGNQANSCLGVIETESLSAALEAADTMLKSQKVKLFKLITIGSGQIAVLVQGNTGAVQAAIEVGAAAAQQKSTVIARSVIPRCHQDLINYLGQLNGNDKDIS
jgi:ethanolamine utilization protein EutM